MRKETIEEEVTDFEAYDYKEFDGMGNVEDEKLLGESTLAKLREQTVEAAVVEEGGKEEAVVTEAVVEEVAVEEDEKEEAVVVEVAVVEETATETAEVGQDEENE